MNTYSQEKLKHNIDINTKNTSDKKTKHVSQCIQQAVEVVHNSSQPLAKTAGSVWSK